MKTRAQRQKQRNKVNPTTPGKSPELKSPPAKTLEEEEDDQKSVASVSSAASAVGRRGLPLHVQKELAIALENSGGIASFDYNTPQAISKLCDQYQEGRQGEEHIFGNRGDPVRRTIGKYVGRWRAYHEKGEYVEKVLNKFNIKSHKNLKKTSDGNTSSDDSTAGSEEAGAGSSEGSSLVETPQRKTTAKESPAKNPPAKAKKKTPAKRPASAPKTVQEEEPVEEPVDLEVPQTILVPETASVASSLNTTDTKTMSSDYIGK
jgi:hypothetical protein